MYLSDTKIKEMTVLRGNTRAPHRAYVYKEKSCRAEKRSAFRRMYAYFTADNAKAHPPYAGYAGYEYPPSFCITLTIRTSFSSAAQVPVINNQHPQANSNNGNSNITSSFGSGWFGQSRNTNTEVAKIRIPKKLNNQRHALCGDWINCLI